MTLKTTQQHQLYFVHSWTPWRPFPCKPLGYRSLCKYASYSQEKSKSIKYQKNVGNINMNTISYRNMPGSDMEAGQECTILYEIN